MMDMMLELFGWMLIGLTITGVTIFILWAFRGEECECPMCASERSEVDVDEATDEEFDDDDDDDDDDYEDSDIDADDWEDSEEEHLAKELSDLQNRYAAQADELTAAKSDVVAASARADRLQGELAVASGENEKWAKEYHALQLRMAALKEEAAKTVQGYQGVVEDVYSALSRVSTDESDDSDDSETVDLAGSGAELDLDLKGGCGA